MDRNFLFFILGLFAAVPVGILTNILTPQVINWTAQRSQTSAAKRIAELEAEREVVTELHNQPTKLMHRTITAAFIILVLVSIANVSWAAPAIFEPLWFLTPTLRDTAFFAFTYAGFSLFAMILFLSTIVVGINHLRLIGKVRNYEQYQEKVEAQIRALGNQP